MAPEAGLVGFSVKEVKGVPNIFGPKGVAQCKVVLEEDVFFANHEYDLEVAELPDDPIVMEKWNVLAWHIEIYVLVAVSFEKVLKVFEADGEIVPAAETDDFVKEVGEFEGEIDSMPGAEAAACGDDGGMRILELDKGKHFGQYIFLILKMSVDAIAGWEVFGVKAFFVDAVEAVDLDLAGCDFAAERVDYLPVFVVIKAGGAGGEEDNGIAGMAENEKFHVPL
jgi:hypothetical protein